jgi:hypothetical protein
VTSAERQPDSPSVTTREHVQYRIESRGPQERAWRYLAFTGAASGMLPPPEAGAYARDPVEILRERIEKAKAESPGLQFRIAGRTVITTTTTTPWEEIS